MNLGRRAAMKLLGVSPMALGGAKTRVTELMAGVPLSATLPSTNFLSANSRAVKLFGDGIAAEMRQLEGDLRLDFEMRRQLRIDGIDPDIAALRSCAKAYKCRKQLERDNEVNSLCLRLTNLLWN